LFTFYLVSVGIAILMTILMLNVDKKRGKKEGGVGGFFLFTILCLIPIINILMALILIISLFSISNEKYASDEEKAKIQEKNLHTHELMNSKRELRSSNIACLNGITYIGGHESFSQSKKGNLYLKEDKIVFIANLVSGMFEVPLNQIDEITYDTSEKITLSRFLVLGLASVIFKKKTYYLIVNYTNEIGTKNQIIFESGNVRQQNFVNAMNVGRNNYLKTIHKEEPGKNFLEI